MCINTIYQIFFYSEYKEEILIIEFHKNYYAYSKTNKVKIH